MAGDYTSRTQKAAATRAENVEKERRLGERLACETEGGRSAKHKALENRVWKNTDEEKANSRENRDEEKANSHDEPRLKNIYRTSESSKEKTSKKGSPPSHGKKNGKKTKKTGKKNETRQRRDGPGGDNDNDTDHNLMQRHPPPAASLAESDGESERDLRRRSENHNYAEDKTPGVVPISLHKKQKPLIVTDNEESGSNSTDSSSDDSSESSESESGVDVDAEPLFVGSTNNEKSTTRRAGACGMNSWPPDFNSDDISEIPPQNLFDVDDIDVEISSYAHSLPPTSDIDNTSSGYEMVSDFADNEPPPPSRKRARSIIGSDESSEDELVQKPVKKSSRKTKSLHRDNALLAERSIVKPPKSMLKLNKKKAKAQPDGNAIPLLVSGCASGRIKLKEQPLIIQDLLHRGIAKASEDVILLRTWPEESSRSQYRLGILLDVCGDKDMLAMYKAGLSDVKKLLKHNTKFAKTMIDVVVDRLASFRSPAKAEAAKLVPYYKLGLGEDCKERVGSLISNLSFHFPGSWGGENGNVWQPNRKEAFLNPVIINTTRAAYFSNPKAVGHRYIAKFSSSMPSKEEEKELPLALLALIMTGIYSCLYEFRNGNQAPTDFDGNIFLAANKEIFGLLESLRETKPVEFHNRMHKLYKLVINDFEDTVPKKSAAYDIIDFD